MFSPGSEQELEFDTKSPRYKKLVAKLKKQAELSEELTLNINFPGTGGTKDSPYPTRVAVDKVVENKPNTAFILFDGVGTEVGKTKKQKISPVHASAYTLEDKPKIFTEKKRGLSRLIKGISNPSESESFGISEVLGGLSLAEGKLSEFGGAITGIGKHANTDRVINTLRQLKKDGLLPKKLVISGHSRGGVNAVYLANAIYKEFGMDIKLHLILTDPVPGPEKEAQDVIVPESVETFTCVYAPKEKKIFFDAYDVNDWKFKNPKTVITCFAIPGTNHGTICTDYLSHKTVQTMSCAANGIEIKPSYCDFDKIIDPLVDEKNATGSRKGQRFYYVSDIPSEVSDVVKNGIEVIRTPIAEYVKAEKENRLQKQLNEKVKHLNEAFDMVKDFDLRYYTFETLNEFFTDKKIGSKDELPTILNKLIWEDTKAATEFKDQIEKILNQNDLLLKKSESKSGKFFSDVLLTKDSIEKLKMVKQDLEKNFSPEQKIIKK